MKVDKPFIEAMRHATHLVRTQGPRAATQFIQGLFRTNTPAPSDDVIEVLDPVADPKPRVADAPPELPAESGQFLSRRFTNEAGARSYKLYVPSSYADAPVPLVVMLHGCTQDADDFATGTRANRWAEARHCLVVYPEQMQRANSHRCWNWFRPQDQQYDRGEPSIIAGITKQVINDYQVDARRVYVAGLSAGGAMAAIMGQSYPELFAAIGVHSGVPTGAAHNVPSAFTVMKNGHSGALTIGRAIPTIVLHGDADQTVHPANGERIVAAAIEAHSIAQPQRSLRTTVEIAEATSDVHAYRRTTHADDSNGILVERWEIHGAGHAWSGGNGAGSHTAERGPDATRAMLDFFNQPAAST